MSGACLRRALGLVCMIALLALPTVGCGGDSHEAANRPATTTTENGEGNGEDDFSNGKDDGSDGGSDGEDGDDGQPSATNTVLIGPVFSGAQRIDFGEVQIANQTTEGAAILNTGEAQLLTGLGIAGDDPEDFALDSGSCRIGGRLEPRQPCVLQITFTPSQSGARTASLGISLENRVVTVNLVGRGRSIVIEPNEDETLTDPTEDATIAP
jgi:hypothetical protein